MYTSVCSLQISVLLWICLDLNAENMTLQMFLAQQSLKCQLHHGILIGSWVNICVLAASYLSVLSRNTGLF